MLRIVNRIASYYFQFHKMEKINRDHQIIMSHASVITRGPKMTIMCSLDHIFLCMSDQSLEIKDY